VAAGRRLVELAEPVAGHGHGAAPRPHRRSGKRDTDAVSAMTLTEQCRAWKGRMTPSVGVVLEASLPESPAGHLRDGDLLSIYTNDHLAASVGGIELVKRMLGEHRGSDYEQPLKQLLGELREENASLSAMMEALGFPIHKYKQLALWIGEKLSRVKLNGRLLSRSPLSTLIEFEFLASAVRAKRSGFETLREVAEYEPRLDRVELDRLIEQANRQHDWVTHTRREVAASVFGGRPEAPEKAAD
jgi:hypothetical protein